MASLVSIFCLLLVCVLDLKRVFSDSEFSLTVVDSPIRDIVWVGESDQVVFSITQEGHLWRSMDGGMTWSDHTASGKLAGVFETSGNYGDYTPIQGVQALLFHEAAAKKIFFRGGADFHWVTDDFGETYKKVKGPDGHLGFVTIRLHPTETDWILAMARRWTCWSQDPSQRKYCADDLFLTKDFGNTWLNLTEMSQGRILSFADFDWGWSKNPEAPQNKVYKKDTILAAVFENRADVRKHLAQHGTNVVAGWDQYVDFVRSHDSFKTAHTKIVACGNQFEIMAGNLFLAVAEHCGERGHINSPVSGVKLKISSDQGASFRDACFPVPFSERGYSVVDATPTAAYVNVDYAAMGQRSAPYGDVFVSDTNLTLFTVSLLRNARSLGGAVDFASVQGLPGVYIANQIELDDDDAVTAHHAGTSESGGGDDMLVRTTTKISLNGGSTWETLRPPRNDSKGERINCDSKQSCSLHLHGTTSWVNGDGFAFVYSHKTTPGLVISTGNVGQYLFQDSTVNTYLSRDGGQSWEEMRKGAHIYEFGDSGGVILMARHGTQGSTTEMLYSLDEGLSWETLTFAKKEDAVDILNIRVEPDNMGKKFIVQALKVASEEGAVRQGVLLAINFGEGFSQYKLCGPNDYEMWTPSLSRCLLGVNIAYQRQYRKSTCWNGDKYEVPKRMLPCTCSDADYQCDFGMEDLYGTCVPILGFQPNNCPVLATKSYVFSPNNKRLVAGDMCTNSSIPLGRYVVSPKSRHLGWPIILTITCLFLVAGVGAFGYLAYIGKIPDEWLYQIPFLERLRYRKVRSNFQSLAEDFGLSGGDDDYEACELDRGP